MPRKKTQAVPEVRLDPTATSFNIAQASVYTGVSPWRLRMAIWQAKLPARKCGKSLIILRADVDAFLKSLPTVSASDAAWLKVRS